MNAVDLNKLKERIEETRTSVFDHFRAEEEILADIEELDVISEGNSRTERTMELFFSAKELVGAAKGIREQADRVMKRLQKIEDQLGECIFDLCGGIGGRVETENWEARVQKTRNSVIVDDKAAVPKKYKRQPPPTPPIEEWDVDKNAVLSACKSNPTLKIKGISLKEGYSLRVNSR